jgi:hypothetical protein
MLVPTQMPADSHIATPEPLVTTHHDGVARVMITDDQQVAMASVDEHVPEMTSTADVPQAGLAPLDHVKQQAEEAMRNVDALRAQLLRMGVQPCV